MADWSKVILTVEHQDTGKSAYSAISVARSAHFIIERMDWAFTTPQDARRAHDAHAKRDNSPEAQQWSSFEKDFGDMHDRQADIGIDHARLVKADFSQIALEIHWGWDTDEIER